jgi:hypothetical protein
MDYICDFNYLKGHYLKSRWILKPIFPSHQRNLEFRVTPGYLHLETHLFQGVLQKGLYELLAGFRTQDDSEFTFGRLAELEEIAYLQPPQQPFNRINLLPELSHYHFGNFNFPSLFNNDFHLIHFFLTTEIGIPITLSIIIGI